MMRPERPCWKVWVASRVYLGDGGDYWCRCEAIDKMEMVKVRPQLVWARRRHPWLPMATTPSGNIPGSTPPESQRTLCGGSDWRPTRTASLRLSDVQRAGWSGPTQQPIRKRAPQKSSRPKTGGQKLRPLSEKAAKRRKKKGLPVNPLDLSLTCMTPQGNKLYLHLPREPRRRSRCPRRGSRKFKRPNGSSSSY